MELSLPGLVGAVVGVGVGLIDYGLVASLVRRAAERSGRAAGTVRRTGAGMDLLMKVLFVVNGLVFAGLGYWFGATVGG